MVCQQIRDVTTPSEKCKVQGRADRFIIIFAVWLCSHTMTVFVQRTRAATFSFSVGEEPIDRRVWKHPLRPQALLCTSAQLGLRRLSHNTADQASCLLQRVQTIPKSRRSPGAHAYGAGSEEYLAHGG